MRLSGLIASIMFVMLLAGMLVPVPWLARESILEFTAREPRNRSPAEPGAAPDNDPATPGGNSGVTDGPLSVS